MAVGDEVERIAQDRVVQAHAVAGEDIAARAGELDGALEIHHRVHLHQFDVGSRLEATIFGE